MASGVHAVALRLKQAKKKKLLLDQQQQQLGLKPPQDRVTSVRIVEPTRSVFWTFELNSLFISKIS